MPVLRRRQDGCYFIRHLFLEVNTWQIDREGYLFLQAHEVHVDGYFSVELFKTMYRRQLVYYGSNKQEFWKERVHLVETDVFSPACLAAFHDCFRSAFMNLISEFVLSSKKPKVRTELPRVIESPEKLFSILAAPERLKPTEAKPKEETFSFGFPRKWTVPEARLKARYHIEVYANGKLIKSLFLPQEIDQSLAERFAFGQTSKNVKRSVVKLWRSQDGDKIRCLQAYSKR